MEGRETAAGQKSRNLSINIKKVFLSLKTASSFYKSPTSFFMQSEMNLPIQNGPLLKVQRNQ
jgi:hypothetical protein